MSSYFFSAFGTFGNPNGFRQSFFLGGNAAIVKDIRTFDLKTDAIMLFPKSRIYSIRKDYAAGRNLISYSVYTFAKEQNSHRGGTFIGSSLLFVDKIGSESLVINVLNEFHDSLEDNNVSEGVITTNHSNKFSVIKPNDFDKIGFNLKDVDDLNFVQNTQKYLVVYNETSPDQLQKLFSKSIDLLNVYDTIYFTESHEIAEFVKQKGIFKIVDANGFTREIESLREERLRLVQSLIQEFEREKEKLTEDRRKIIDDLNKQIDQNKVRHQENEKKIKDSEGGIKIIEDEYAEFSRKIGNVINQLKSDGNLESAKKIYQENKRNFSGKISKNKNIDSLHSISTSGSRFPNVSNSTPKYGNDLSDFNRNDRNSRQKESKLDVYKLATFILLLILITSYSCYFIFFYKGKILETPITEMISPKTTVNNVENAENTIPVESPEVINFALNPTSNSQLNEKDRMEVLKKIKGEIKIDSVVNIIFEMNQSTIKNYYEDQKKNYSAQLYNSNMNSFKIRNQDTIFVDLLTVIPDYK